MNNTLSALTTFGIRMCVPALVLCSWVTVSGQQVSVPTGNNYTAWVQPGINVAAGQADADKYKHPLKNSGQIATRKESNFTSFAPLRVNHSAEVVAYNKGYENDPELGILQADAPCTNCYELLDKRTETQKYFVQEGTDATHFILQSAAMPVHYKDDKGRWRTISNRLQQDAVAGVYATKGRATEVVVNTKRGYTQLKSTEGSLVYNNNLELVYTDAAGHERSLGKANWNNHTAGDDGMKVVDAWPGIDMELGVLNNSLKTNFIVKAAMPAYVAGTLKIRDHLQPGYGLKLNTAQGNSFTGSIKIVNKQGEDVFQVQKAVAYEQNSISQGRQDLAYHMGSYNTLDIEIPGSLFGKAASAYPLVIDPLVSGTVTGGFSYDPAFCTNTDNVSIPAAATLTDIQITYNYYGITDALWANAELEYAVNGLCGTIPVACTTGFATGIPGPTTCGLTNTSFWTGTYGTWGTTPGCLPAFSCYPYTLPFQLYAKQTYTDRGYCEQSIFATASGFTVTVYGTTLSLPVITPITSVTLCLPATTTLTATPAGGTWSSDAPGIATIGTDGLVTGIANGTTTIEYSTGGTCPASKVVAVNTFPTITPITGLSAICQSAVISLSDGTSGGVWSSSAIGKATVTGSGGVTGVAAGTATISYVISNSCGSVNATKTMTVTASPAAAENITTLAGTGVSDYTGDGGDATIATVRNVYGMTNDTSGNLYVADFGNGVIRKISPAGIISTFAAGLSQPISVATDKRGNVFVSEYGWERITKINPAGVRTQYFSSLFWLPTDICTDTSGTVYIADQLAHQVFKMDTAGVISVFAGAGGTAGYAGDGGPAVSAFLTAPTGVAADTNGNVYISCWDDSHIRKVNAAGIISTIAGTGVLGYSGDGGPATVATFGEPFALSVDKTGNLYIADVTNNRIREIDMSTGTINTIAGTGAPSYNGDGIPATTANISPNDMFIDRHGDLLIADGGNQRVRKVARSVVGLINGNKRVCVGSTIALSDTVFGGSGTWSSSAPAVGSVSSTGVVAGLANGTVTISYTIANSCSSYYATTTVTVIAYPTVVAITGGPSVCQNASVTLSDAVSGGIWHSAATAIATIDSNTGVAYGWHGGTVTISYTNTNYCGEVQTVTVLTVIPSYAGGNIISTVVGNGTVGYAGDGGPATAAEISSVMGFAIDTEGNMYIATDELLTGSVRKINTSGIISSFVASADYATGVAADRFGNVYYTLNGDGKVMKKAASGALSTFASGLSGPYGICTDRQGNVYATSGSNVNKITPAGVMTVFAGNGTSGYGGDGGPATSATLADVYSVASDTAGNIFIGCGFDAHIRKVNTAGIISTIAGNGGSGFGGDGGPALAAKFNGNISLATDRAGNLYVVDVNNFRVRKIDVTTGIVNTIAGTSLNYYNGDGIPAYTANMGVRAVCTDAQDNVYVSDELNSRIRKITTNLTGKITGDTSVCVGATITLSDTSYTTYGPVWSSSNPLVATVSSSTGAVTGVAPGVVNITYTLSGSCGTAFTTKTISVYNTPSAGVITGAAIVCTGSSIDLSDASSGGHWSASNTNATVNASGVTNGVSAGVVTITYAITTCITVSASKTITVDPTPVAGTITGVANSLCVDSSITLTDVASGGAWSAVNGNVTIPSPGVVDGVTVGIDTVVYAVTNVCGTAKARYPVAIFGCTAGVNSVKHEGDNIVVYPNPNYGVFTLHVSSGSAAQVKVVVKNILGETVGALITFTNKNTDIVLNQPPGIYLLMAYTGQNTYTVRVTLTK